MYYKMSSKLSLVSDKIKRLFTSQNINKIGNYNMIKNYIIKLRIHYNHIKKGLQYI